MTPETSDFRRNGSFIPPSSVVRRRSSLILRERRPRWLVHAFKLLLAVTALVNQVHGDQLAPTSPLLLNSKSAIDWETYRECGSNCLYLVCQILGVKNDLRRLKRALPLDANGSSLAELARAASEVGLFPVAARLSPNELGQVRAPSIVHLRRMGVEGGDGDHYAVYLGITEARGGVVLLDPPLLPHEVSSHDFGRMWTGNVMMFARSDTEATAWRRALSWKRINSPNFWLSLSTAIILAAGLWFLTMSGRGLKGNPNIGRVARTKRSKKRRITRATPFLIICCLTIGCQRQAGGTFHVEDDVYEFGFVPRGGKDVAIRFTNAGSGTLAIEKLSATCPCQVPRAPDSLGPGEEGTITIRLRGAPGMNSSKLLVYTTDAASPRELFMTWFGEYPPRFDPPRLVIRDTPGGRQERTVRMTYASGDRKTALVVKKIRIVPNSLVFEHVRSKPRALYTAAPASGGPAVFGEEQFTVRLRDPFARNATSGICEVVVSQAEIETTVTLPFEIQRASQVSYGGNLYFYARTPDALVGMTQRAVITVEGNASVPILRRVPALLAAVISPVGKKDGGLTPPSSESRGANYMLEVRVVKPPNNGAVDASIDLEVAGLADSGLSVPVFLRSN